MHLMAQTYGQCSDTILFQQAIGLQNLELKLNKLARDPKILASLEEMRKDIKSGRRGDF